MPVGVPRIMVHSGAVGRRVGRSRPTAGLPADDVLAEQMALGRPHDRAQRTGQRRRPAQCRERRAVRLLALSDGPTTRCQCRRGRCACRRRSDLRRPRPAGCAASGDRHARRAELRPPCLLSHQTPNGIGDTGSRTLCPSYMNYTARLLVRQFCPSCTAGLILVEAKELILHL